ncbi:hypothetical protein BDW60DRAFT_153382 [Aspergillus nidulans var. acristatus]
MGVGTVGVSDSATECVFQVLSYGCELCAAYKWCITAANQTARPARLILCDQVPLNNESFNSSSNLQRRGLALSGAPLIYLQPSSPLLVVSPDFVPLHPLIPILLLPTAHTPRTNYSRTTLRHCPSKPWDPSLTLQVLSSIVHSPCQQSLWQASLVWRCFES